MHQPRPYGLHAIGLPLTDKDEAFISSVAARITNLKKLSGVDGMKMVYDLPDGGYVIVQDMGGNFRVITHKPTATEEVIFDGLANDYIPMLYSGVINNSIAYEGKGIEINFTSATRLRLNQYDSNIKDIPESIFLQRFAIDYDVRFSEFNPSPSSKVLRTQYGQVRPTLYSGAMSEVVQIVGGYGRQDFDELPDTDIERARIIVPASIADQIKEELGSLRLAGFKGVADSKGQYKYNYKFNDTDAVSFDSTGKPWLIRINPAGVYAMPLPIIPATATKAFYRYMVEVEDEEILLILNRFGAMPSGETFPTKGFEAWRKAGVIIKICDASDFYSHIAYSSACGWSLNSNGTEGYNTCYDYYDEEGLGYGLTYKLRLSLSPSLEHNGRSAVDINSDDPRYDKITKYLSELIPKISSGSDEHRAILYKLRRVDITSIYNRSLFYIGSGDIDYWRDLELDPIADHTGNISEVYRGYLYHKAIFKYQPQIKFPEPLVGGCISHDFLPLYNGVGKKKYPNSDTIMFAYYIGNSLKTVKYFIDWADFDRKTESNFELYMREGSWQQVEYIGKSQLQGYFYSSDMDEREIVAAKTITTNIVGEDKGYDAKPFWGFDFPYAMAGTMARQRYYTHTKNVDTINGKELSLAICIPYLCRNAIIQAKKTSSSTINTETLELLSVSDPTFYRFWTYHQVMAKFGGTTMKNPKGVPYPEWGSPVWVEEEKYVPTAENNWADSGPWVSSLPENYKWLINPNPNSWAFEGGGSPPKIENTYNSKYNPSAVTGNLQLSMYKTIDTINQLVPEDRYFTGSPNDSGFFFYKDATAIVFGESVYRNTSETINGVTRKYFGYTRLADHKSAHCFIGVINE